jgi:hypothetical protein
MVFNKLLKMKLNDLYSSYIGVRYAHENKGGFPLYIGYIEEIRKINRILMP